jgi:adenylate cyclase
MPDETQRRLAAIVVADVVGYSRLMGADESGTLAALRKHRYELIDPLIDKHGGRLVKTTGDGLLMEFPSVVAAVQCAIATQEGIAERNEGIPDDEAIRFRIGVHVGDVIIEGDDIFGDGVNIAARIEPLAQPDGVSLSDDAYRQVRDRLDVVWEDGGDHELKNIARPIRVWRPTSHPSPCCLSTTCQAIRSRSISPTA